MARAAQAAVTTRERTSDYEGEERALVARIETFVRSQAEKLLAAVRPMLAVDAALL
jgi:hypothetical protein